MPWTARSVPACRDYALLPQLASRFVASHGWCTAGHIISGCPWSHPVSTANSASPRGIVGCGFAAPGNYRWLMSPILSEPAEGDLFNIQANSRRIPPNCALFRQSSFVEGNVRGRLFPKSSRKLWLPFLIDSHIMRIFCPVLH